MQETGWDVVVVGQGAVGLSAAMHLAQQGYRVLAVDKEDAPGTHQSGRNSGVIHAGYNVKPGTRKAQYCVEGNRRMHAFCRDRGVDLAPGGIAVVAHDEQEHAVLEQLHSRARGNGVAVDMLDGEALRRIEPHASGTTALHAPEASSVDAAGYVRALAEAAREAGATLRNGVAVTGWAAQGKGSHVDGHSSQDGTGPGARPGVQVHTRGGTIQARAMLNAAGLHADRVAGALCPDMRVIPFRGFYARLRPQRAHLVRSHIYAAPDLDFPFLGVHLSRRTDGAVAVGPGAMLAFGREAYRFASANPRDMWGSLAWPGFWRMLADRRIRRLVRTEVDKSLRLRAIWREAARLVPELRPGDLVRGTAGNRAQMVDRAGKLVEDIVVRQDGPTVHVLNAVSPGLTCSLPFGQDLARQVEKAMG